MGRNTPNCLLYNKLTNNIKNIEDLKEEIYISDLGYKLLDEGLMGTTTKIIINKIQKLSGDAKCILRETENIKNIKNLTSEQIIRSSKSGVSWCRQDPCEHNIKGGNLPLSDVIEKRLMQKKTTKAQLSCHEIYFLEQVLTGENTKVLPWKNMKHRSANKRIGKKPNWFKSIEEKVLTGQDREIKDEIKNKLENSYVYTFNEGNLNKRQQFFFAYKEGDEIRIGRKISRTKNKRENKEVINFSKWDIDRTDPVNGNIKIRVNQVNQTIMTERIDLNKIILLPRATKNEEDTRSIDISTQEIEQRFKDLNHNPSNPRSEQLTMKTDLLAINKHLKTILTINRAANELTILYNRLKDQKKFNFSIYTWTPSRRTGKGSKDNQTIRIKENTTNFSFTTSLTQFFNPKVLDYLALYMICNIIPKGSEATINTNNHTKINELLSFKNTPSRKLDKLPHHWIIKEIKNQIHKTNTKLTIQNTVVGKEDINLQEISKYSRSFNPIYTGYIQENTFHKYNHTYNNKVIQEHTRNLIKYKNQIKNALHCTYNRDTYKKSKLNNNYINEIDWETSWLYLNNNIETTSLTNNDNLTSLKRIKFKLYTNNLMTMDILNARYPGTFTNNMCPIEGCQEKENLTHMWKCKAYKEEANKIRLTFKTNIKKRIETSAENKNREKETRKKQMKTTNDILKKYVDDPTLENWVKLIKGLIPLEITESISKLNKSEESSMKIITEELTLAIKEFSEKILSKRYVAFKEFTMKENIDTNNHKNNKTKRVPRSKNKTKNENENKNKEDEDLKRWKSKIEKIVEKLVGNTQTEGYFLNLKKYNKILKKISINLPKNPGVGT